MTCVWAAPPRCMSRGLRAYQRVYVQVSGLTCDLSGAHSGYWPHVRAHAPRQTPLCPKRRPPRPRQPVFSVFHRGGLCFGRRTTPSCDLRASKRGGMTPSKAPTRRRHAARGLRMAQNPHYRPNRRPPHGLLGEDSPLTAAMRYKRRQSEPKNQYFQRKSRQIDDVCNNHTGIRTKNSSD